MLAPSNEVTQQQQYFILLLLNIPNYELFSIKLHVVYTSNGLWLEIIIIIIIILLLLLLLLLLLYYYYCCKLRAV